MLDKDEYLDIAGQAYDIANDAMHRWDDHPGNYIVRPSNREFPRSCANRIAAEYGNCKVVRTDLIRDGYGSWLIKTSNQYIGINSSQLNAWARHELEELSLPKRILAKLLSKLTTSAYVESHRSRYRSMEVRCILHEVGHILLHAGKRKTGAMDPEASPGEEEEAWVFTLNLLGVLLGSYAVDCRTKNQTDDSPSAMP